MPRPSIFENCRIPAIAAPMFLVSGKELVVSSCKAGLPATFPALNLRTTEEFEQQVVDIKQELGPDDATWGVNLIVHKTNPRLEPDLAICIKHQVPLVITSLGAVKELVGQIHSYGGIVFHDVTNPKHGKKAAEAGVDGLIAVSAGAGGHAGTTNPFALIAELRSFFDKTIVLAGSISSGSDVAAALVMGADLAYMGTRFIATKESLAQSEYKDMLVRAHSGDIVHTAAVSGIPANFMRQSLEQNGIDPQQAADGGLVGQKLSMDEEARAWKTIWSAGHGTSAIQSIPSVEELVNQLHSEFQSAKSRLDN